MARSTRFFSLAGELERVICTLKPGDALPSEQTLSERFSVSKPTLRKALQELASRGLIQTVNGVGSVVCELPVGIMREVVFLCDDLVFFADTLKSFCSKATELNYMASVVPLCGNLQERKRIIQTVLKRNPAGIVLYSHSTGKLNWNGALLHLMRRSCERGDLLSFHNGEAVAGMVKLLYRKNCRRFALFGTPSVSASAAEERINGFLDGLRRVRLQFRPEYLCTAGTPQEEREAFFDLFRNSASCPDAVCCLNDTCAGEFLKELEKRNISAEKIMLCGFDASPAAEFFRHKLLTAAPALEELGIRAAELLIRRIENPNFSEITETLKTEIIEIG